MRSIGKLIATGSAIAFAAGCGSGGVEPGDTPGVNDPTATPTPVAKSIEAPASPVLYPTATPELLLTFVHQQGLWQISYLANSEVRGPEWDDENTFEGVEFVVPFGEESLIALGVTRVEGTEYATSKEWSQSILERVRDSSSSYELISWRDVNVSAFQAYEAIYLRTGGTFAFAHVELHLVAGSDSYRIVGVTGQEVWADVEGLLRTLVYSFQLRE